eukprot:264671_1
MAPFRYRRNSEYDRRHCSYYHRLNIRSFYHHSHYDQYNSYSRPLLPRNNIHYSILQSNYNYNNNNTNNTGQNIHNNNNPVNGRRWRRIVWDALKKTSSTVGSEISNVITNNIVEFGIAIISAYISNYMFG